MGRAVSTSPDSRLVLAVLERAAEMLEAGATARGIISAATTAIVGEPHRSDARANAVWRAVVFAESQWRLASVEVSEWEEAHQIAQMLRSHILSVCLFVGALAGALPVEARRLIAAYCATKPDEHDPYALLGLVDLVEERGLTGPLAQWAEERQGWLEVTEHEHVWLPWVSGDEKRALRDCLGPPDFDLIRRCTCGMFEHETRRRSRKTLTAAARRRLDEIRDRAVREFRGHRADPMFVDDPHDLDPPTVHDK